MLSHIQSAIPSTTPQNAPGLTIGLTRVSGQPISGLILSRKARPKSRYLLNPVEGTIDGKQSLCIGTTVDTEFWQPCWRDVLAGQAARTRQGVTVQIRGCLAGDPLILIHPDYIPHAAAHKYPLRHPIFRTGFAPVDYLQFLGYDARLDRCEEPAFVDSLPRVQFVTYAYFALAEVYQIVLTDFLVDVDDLILNKFLPMQRRIRTSDKVGKWPIDYCAMPWILTLQGYQYGVEWCCVDLGAIHGAVSYKRFCANTGIHLSNKDVMKDMGLIEHMDRAYAEYPEIYDTYATEDLKPYEALQANKNMFSEIMGSLGIAAYDTGEPSLTIGSTVREMFESKICQLFDLAPDDAKGREAVFEQFCIPASAEALRKRVDSTTALLSKATGGRCRNNRPTLACAEGVLVDIDLKGCYGEGQRNQLYPFGKPLIVDYPAESRHNTYRTLQQFLTGLRWGKTDCELVPGLWQARVSLKPGYTLEHPQDFLESWFDFRIRDLAEKPFDPRIADLDNPELELNPRSGITKILTHEIQNAVITHDFVQWLYAVCNEKQRRELLDNLYVHAAMFYPASQRVDSIETLLEQTDTHTGQNRCLIAIQKGLMTKIAIEQECYAWYAVNLGDFITNDLMAYRALHTKGTGQNEMYKLTINTIYGDLVSPHFAISNVVVANNITARARAACWYMEKGLYTVQSITDGGVFDMNRVVYPASNQRVTSQSVVQLHQVENLQKQRKIRLAPLGGYDRIAVSWDPVDYTSLEPDDIPKAVLEALILNCEKDGVITIRKGYKAMKWINEESFAHLQRLFPDVDILHAPSTRLDATPVDGKPQKIFIPRIGQFEFEAKSVFHTGTFHGSANYRLVNPGETKIAMRSYEKKKHDTTQLIDGVLEAGTRYDRETPAAVFLASLTNPTSVPRADVFVKSAMLKPGEYVAHYDAKYKQSFLKPGDSIFKPGLLREFSLAQFTFQTVAQYKAVVRQWQRCKDSKGEYVETYFRNPDSTLNYQAMIETVDRLLSEGCMDLVAARDEHDNIYRTQSREHPAYAALKATKRRVSEAYKTPISTESDDPENEGD